MLSIDPSLHAIEVDEPDILSLYQAQCQLLVAIAGQPPSRCNAWACAVRKKESFQVYLALLNDCRKLIVYASPVPLLDEAVALKTVGEALALAEEMGFTMDEVNLNYGAAMRAVIIRNIAAFNPPRQTLATAVSKGDRPAVAGAPGRKAKSAPEPPPAAKPAISAPKPLKVPEVKTVVMSTVTAAGPAVDQILPLELELRRLNAANAALAERLAQETAAREKAAADLSEVREQYARSRKELEAAERALTEQTASLKDLLKQVSDEREAAARERDELVEVVRRKEGSEEKQAAMAEREREVLRQLTDAEKRMAAVIAERDLLAGEQLRLAEELSSAVTERDASRVAQAMAETSLERVLAEKTGTQNQLDAAREKVSLLSQEVASLKEDVGREQSRVLELEALREATTAELEALKVPPVSEQGKDVAAEAAAGELLRLESELRNLQERYDDLGILHQATVAKLAAVNLALQPDREEREQEQQLVGVTSGRTGLTPVPVSPVTEPVAERPVNILQAVRAPQTPWDVFQAGSPVLSPACQGPEVPEMTGFFGEEEFGGFGDGGSDLLFHLRKDISSVRYAREEDVVALKRSVNVARVAPEGDTPRDCLAYICSIRSGAEVKVQVALYFPESGRTCVYVPERQPEGEEGYAEAMRGAEVFTETVGFMMDTLELGTDPAVRAARLAGAPVLKCEQRQ